MSKFDDLYIYSDGFFARNSKNEDLNRTICGCLANVATKMQKKIMLKARKKTHTTQNLAAILSHHKSSLVALRTAERREALFFAVFQVFLVIEYMNWQT